MIPPFVSAMTGVCTRKRAPSTPARVAPQVEGHLEPFADPERLRDPAGSLDLARVPLAIADRQRAQREPLALRDRGGGVGVESAAQKYYRSHWVIGSDAPRTGSPDVLVQLQLKSRGDAIGEHPFRQHFRIEHAVDR